MIFKVIQTRNNYSDNTTTVTTDIIETVGDLLRVVDRVAFVLPGQLTYGSDELTNAVGKFLVDNGYPVTNYTPQP